MMDLPFPPDADYSAEPQLDLFAHELMNCMKRRRSPFDSGKAKWIDSFSVIQIKLVLLMMNNSAVNMLMDESFAEVLKVNGVPFPDPTIEYPGIYAGMFVYDDGSQMNYRDMCRIANILIDAEATETVLSQFQQHVPGNTAAAAVLLGRHWKDTLQTKGCWIDFDEIVVPETQMSDTPEYESDDDYSSDIGEFVPTQAPVFSSPAPRLVRNPFLDRREMDGVPEIPSIYVGWSKHPLQRLRQHKSRI